MGCDCYVQVDYFDVLLDDTLTDAAKVITCFYGLLCRHFDNSVIDISQMDVFL